MLEGFSPVVALSAHVMCLSLYKPSNDSGEVALELHTQSDPCLSYCHDIVAMRRCGQCRKNMSIESFPTFVLHTFSITYGSNSS